MCFTMCTISIQICFGSLLTCTEAGIFVAYRVFYAHGSILIKADSIFWNMYITTSPSHPQHAQATPKLFINDILDICSPSQSFYYFLSTDSFFYLLNIFSFPTDPYFYHRFIFQNLPTQAFGWNIFILTDHRLDIKIQKKNLKLTIKKWWPNPKKLKTATFMGLIYLVIAWW